jgi:hypothetical protein
MSTWLLVLDPLVTGILIYHTMHWHNLTKNVPKYLTGRTYNNVLDIPVLHPIQCRSQWPRGLRRRSTAAPLLRSGVRIPAGAWMFVYCVCCVLSGRGLCDELITRPEESDRLWRVIVCDQETSWTRRTKPALDCRAREKKKIIIIHPFQWFLKLKMYSAYRLYLLLESIDLKMV